MGADEGAEILSATRELLAEMIARNGLSAADMISVIFTVTADLRAEFPARAARELGWKDVPLLCTVEMAVPGALQRCIRVLLHTHAASSSRDPRHVYLRDAATLRAEPPTD